MKVKVSELTGEALDYAVGKANGWVDYPEDSIEHGSTWHCDPERSPFGPIWLKSQYAPSTDWSIGGPIIEREKIQISPSKCGKYWQAVSFGDNWWCYTDDLSVLTIAMRCYVASKLGKTVDIPNDLLLAPGA